jgi:hypothetical protein
MFGVNAEAMLIAPTNAAATAANAGRRRLRLCGETVIEVRNGPTGVNLAGRRAHQGDM